MKRREFVTLIGSAAFAQVFRPIARAQETGRAYQLGIIYGGSRETPRIAAFFDELKLLGFAEGKNLNVARGGFNLRNDSVCGIRKDVSQIESRRDFQRR
jgi:hypothetical protein